MVSEFEKEPLIKVGLMTKASEVRLSINGSYSVAEKGALVEGNFIASRQDGLIKLNGATQLDSRAIRLVPVDFNSSSITVHGVTIGIDFHWQREESQKIQGALELICGESGITVVNELPLESYLVSVISSEMSASCPPDLLKAHAIVSRSWLLAQLSQAKSASDGGVKGAGSQDEIIRWYNRESHAGFDVCADDHCQRYQGISKAFSDEAFGAIKETRGKVIVWNDEICDARYSKSCGGVTETYDAAWEEKEVPYLVAVYDGPGKIQEFPMPLNVESNAEKWITSSPEAYCNMASPELLSQILPGFDQETRDFYRWSVEYSQDELCEMLRSKLGIDFGRVRALEAVERGKSGRLVRLAIKGEKRSVIIGKELEIRRALSRSHLYSSALVIKAGRVASGYPQSFRLTGAGWGHGVGLCQIGAAVMAVRGFGYEEILSHYFPGAALITLFQ